MSLVIDISNNYNGKTGNDGDEGNVPQIKFHIVMHKSAPLRTWHKMREREREIYI